MYVIDNSPKFMYLAEIYPKIGIIDWENNWLIIENGKKNRINKAEIWI